MDNLHLLSFSHTGWRHIYSHCLSDQRPVTLADWSSSHWLSGWRIKGQSHWLTGIAHTGWVAGGSRTSHTGWLESRILAEWLVTHTGCVAGDTPELAASWLRITCVCCLSVTLADGISTHSGWVAGSRTSHTGWQESLTLAEVLEDQGPVTLADRSRWHWMSG